MILPQEKTITISPIGILDEILIKGIRLEINRVFGFGTEIEILLDNIDFAFDTTRNQYHSTAVLEKLADLASPKAVKILAITEVDLFIPILTHVYGEAQLGGKACIISTKRLSDESPSLANPGGVFGRAKKEAIHELGHTFGLRHCRDHACIMHYCRSIKDVDRKTDQLCRYCSVLLDDELKRMMKKGQGQEE